MEEDKPLEQTEINENNQAQIEGKVQEDLNVDEEDGNPQLEEDLDSGSEKSEIPQINLNKFNDFYKKEYDISFSDQNKQINFLQDYSKHLIETGSYDPKLTMWLLENRSNFSSLINNETLKWITKQEKYYRTENVINSLTYRLSKFGQLAPKNEILRSIGNEDNEENFRFYNDDSLIDNEEEEERDTDFLRLQSKSTGLVTEEDIIKEMKKKRKKSKVSKHLVNLNSVGVNPKNKSNYNKIRDLINESKEKQIDLESGIIKLSSEIDVSIQDIKVIF